MKKALHKPNHNQQTLEHYNETEMKSHWVHNRTCVLNTTKLTLFDHIQILNSRDIVDIPKIDLSEI